MPPTIALEPMLQYGALGLLAIVVMGCLTTAWFLSRALIATMRAVATGLHAVRETLSVNTTTLLAMRGILAGSMLESRDTLGLIRARLRDGRCTYDPTKRVVSLRKAKSP